MCGEGQYAGQAVKEWYADFLLGDEEWKDRAACNGESIDLFFPPKGKTKLALDGQIICSKCPVLSECREYRERTKTSDGLWSGELFRYGRTG